ncbi:MAG: hypothetical protein KDL31_00820 [Kiritimatiellae bacterium]|nr:hypothetical protein [Kiritimatiellia bacterium]
MATLNEALGFGTDLTAEDSQRVMIEYTNVKLAALGLPVYGREQDFPFLAVGQFLLSRYQEQLRLLSNYHCPADQRIQAFLDDYLGGNGPIPRLPTQTFVLDRHGLARTLSLPPDADFYDSGIIRSYRTLNGILHNPVNDRRTTQGVFHVAEGGLPVADDKKTVPRIAFARLLAHALNPPAELMRLPFTSTQQVPAEVMVSLLLRPVICPEIPGYLPRKSMEIRFFVPGSMVANLDFVESIFGNAGDPYLPDNNAGLDADHWSGHTGCVILAPHLTQLTKKELGLPCEDDATPRQRRNGMFWRDPDERYNDGSPFKITARDTRGVMVTIIADNYFGYCKKEVKTQISYAANLYGLCEEEHAGGARVFPRYDLGEAFRMHSLIPDNGQTFAEVVEHYGSLMDLRPEGYGVDKTYPRIVYLPEDAHITLDTQKIVWIREGEERGLKLLPEHVYVYPSGYKIMMLHPSRESRWRLVGEVAEGTVCHKPCTVSGGGKSEISKPISDAMIDGPVFVADLKRDFDLVDEIINKDYSTRFRIPRENHTSRSILSPKRTLGSVIKLLTPSSENSQEFNQWLAGIPQSVKDLVFIVKRYHKADWGEEWRNRFSVDTINGKPGYELRYRNHKINTRYVRVGYTDDGSWRIFGVRKDYMPSQKLSIEDDITASVVVPSRVLPNLEPGFSYPSAKLIENCEFRFFQRPDDAIVRGYDRKTEADMARSNNFFCNYEPLDHAAGKEIVEDAIRFGQFTPVMQEMLQRFAAADRPDYVVTPAHPRIVDGKPTKNPRYLQNRPDLETPMAWYLADVACRLYRKIPLDQPVPNPVHAVLPGRRNNPPEGHVRALSCFNPIHYMELPELFMEFIASITGKSPSTTGAGSEGALTKGPFNALLPVHDLNNALISMILTGYDAFITSAGCVGPKYRVDHDVSLVVPELWARMSPEERTPRALIAQGCLEPVTDFTYEGRTIPASLLGYRMTARFMRIYGGRMFTNPDAVFTEEMLKPELQDLAMFVDAIENISEAHRWVAEQYFRDGSYERAIPPIQALLQIMVHGHADGKTLDDPEIRQRFDRENMLASPWYQERLAARQQRGIALQNKIIQGIEAFLDQPEYEGEGHRLNLEQRLAKARERLCFVEAPEFLQALRGTIGADPFSLDQR